MLEGITSVGAAKWLELTDEQLFLLYRDSRDKDLFAELMVRYESEIFAFLKRFVGNPQQAEDIFQATFLSVHLKMDQFQVGRRFRPWLYAIATNKAIDSQRRARRHRSVSIDVPFGDGVSESRDSLATRLMASPQDPDEGLAKQEMDMRLKQALSQLNGPTQELIDMAFYQQRKYSDIAEHFRIPVGTVKSRVHTAMRKLNEVWRRMFGDSDTE